MPVVQHGETVHRDGRNTGNEEGVNGDQRGGNDSSTRPSERMFSRIFRTARLAIFHE